MYNHKNEFHCCFFLSIMYHGQFMKMSMSASLFNGCVEFHSNYTPMYSANLLTLRTTNHATVNNLVFAQFFL